jgi:MFS family permease
MAASPNHGATEQSLSSLSPFQNKAFRNIWLASLCLYFGGAAQLVVVSWILTRSGQPANIIAMAQTASSLPILLFALFGGGLADLHDRRHLMIISQSLVLLSGLSALFIDFTHHVAPLLLLACTFVAGTGSAFFAPPMQASVMTTLPRDQIGAAVTLNSLALNVARSGGPAVASVILALMGSRAVFGLSVLCFFVGVLTLLGVSVPPSPKIQKRIFATMRDGLVHAWRSHPLRAVLLRSWMFTAIGSAVWSLWPLLARAHRADAKTFGLYLGALGIGAIVGSLFAQRLRTVRPPDQIMAVVAPVFGFACLAAAIGGTPLALLALFVAGTAWVQALTTCTACAQLLAPSALAGRVASIAGMSTFGGLAVGSMAWGWIANAVGVQDDYVQRPPHGRHADHKFLATDTSAS